MPLIQCGEERRRPLDPRATRHWGGKDQQIGKLILVSMVGGHREAHVDNSGRGMDLSFGSLERMSGAFQGPRSGDLQHDCVRIEGSGDRSRRWKDAPPEVKGEGAVEGCDAEWKTSRRRIGKVPSGDGEGAGWELRRGGREVGRWDGTALEAAA
ncbi:hypothetical protein E2562_000531 [Oryza meyeriana var. granulata]|uniref:Uncharacterized protein n=1 Tax=Oryza meyeriana var. granulata TaxID=110450 RepID=A0A6G1DTZ5_9ORYZ|nr:hypothetical protein E2562_000531 [Oryza meyeriana var. granulata]